MTTCLFSNGNHDLERCFKFRDKSFEERRKFVLDKRLCIDCLRINHFVRRCRQFRACFFIGCGKRHHSLLHPPGDRVIEEATKPADRTSVDTREGVNVDTGEDPGGGGVDWVASRPPLQGRSRLKYKRDPKYHK